MREDVCKALVAAPDKLAFLLELPEMYGAPGREELSRLFIAAEGLNAADKALVRLGVAYFGRLGGRESVAQLLSEIDAAQKAARNSIYASFAAEVVRASLLHTRGGDPLTAVGILEHIKNRLRFSDHHFLFGLASRALGAAYMLLGRHRDAEASFEDALATFRRFEHKVSYAATLNDMGVLAKRTARYERAQEVLQRAADVFTELGVAWFSVMSSLNLANVCRRRGEWPIAIRLYEATIRTREELISTSGEGTRGNAEFLALACEAELALVKVMQRRFSEARQILQPLLGTIEFPHAGRHAAIVHEFLGELCVETARYQEARSHLGQAYSITVEILPDSDVMTEILRRQAELEYRCGHYDPAREIALRGASLCKKIGDRYELGAVLRILGQVHAAQGRKLRAKSAYEASIRTLKSIHETYELMKANLAYGAFLVDQGSAEAETHLIEARQLARRLDVTFFDCQASAQLTRHATRLRLYEDARAHLDAAENLYEGLQPCDREQVKELLEVASSELDQAILRTSVASAEELKTICRVYEEARFPMEEMRTEMAYQVAQSVGAEGLFMVRRRKGGHEIPLTYNLPKSEAKEIVRRLDRDRETALLGVDGEPRVLAAYTGQAMIAVPAPGEWGYILCTLFEGGKSLGPRQVEFLLAGAEALERVVMEEVGARGTKADSEAFMSDEPEDARRIHPRGSFKEILTADPGMIRLIRLAERASASRAPIHLEGETGVGKELFARAIHQASSRREKEFVAVNAGGMPVNLLESQLFGHVRGAFTDAVTDRAGLVEEAKGGTLFLDEVGEMGEELQVKLLRLLENGEYRRLGDNTVNRADVRIISATNRDLAREVQRGRFRRDLFYRMGAVKVAIPPLRDRRRDIPLLIRHFLRECALYNGLVDRYFQIDMKAMEALELYEWPGNVRELYNEVLRIVSLIGNAETIRFGMLSDEIKSYLSRKQRADGMLERTVEEFERRLILEALEKNEWNRMRTAEDIGVPRTTLLAKMKRLNIATRADVTARRAV